MSEVENQAEKVEIGSVLKAARDAQGVALDEVAATLRIRSDHLRALEEDDYDRLPGSVYAIGFIRTYATHLGLNAAELITRYKATTQPLHADDPDYDPQSEPEQVSGMAKSAAVVGGIFVIYLIWLIAGGAGGPEQTPPAAKAPEVDAAAADDVAARVVQPKPSAAKPTPTPKPAAKPAVKPAAVDVAAPVARPAPPPRVSNDTRAVLPEADPLSSDPPVSVAPMASLTPSEPVKVEIRAARRTWMRLENDDGRVLFSSIIREGETFELADDNYTLATRDAGALQFTIDGEAVGPVGRRGQILTARRIARTGVLAMRP